MILKKKILKMIKLLIFQNYLDLYQKNHQKIVKKMMILATLNKN